MGEIVNNIRTTLFEEAAYAKQDEMILTNKKIGDD